MYVYYHIILQKKKKKKEKDSLTFPFPAYISLISLRCLIALANKVKIMS